MEGGKLVNGVAVISCSQERNVNIIRNILGVGSLPEPLKVTSKICRYPLHVETKYYSADLNLVPIEEKDLVSQEFANFIDAVIFHFNNEEVESFNEVQRWLPFIEKFEPSVKLLTCNNYNSDDFSGIAKRKVLNWCLQNGFELIELHPTDDSDEEDALRDTKGYQRVVQALHANSWSNMQLKDPPRYQPASALSSALQAEKASVPEHCEGANAAECSSHATDHSKEHKESLGETSAQKIDALFEEDRWLFDAVGREDPGGEAFEAMFSRIMNMKEKAALLEGDEKKLYAEKVALAFWEALGGDSEETLDPNGDEYEI